MDPKSYPFLLAHQAEHQIRLRQSERRRDAEQAAGPQTIRLIAFPARAWMSATLIAAGERLQQKITMEPMQADAIR